MNECIFGEQKTTDKVEPMFNVGDWIVSKTSNLVYCVDSILFPQSKCYCLSYNGGTVLVNFSDEQNYRLWTIQDAKDGDVLATKDAVFIFKYMDKTGLSLCKSYCEVIGNSKLGFGFDFSINDVYPATKEQRGTLFAKMKEVGYEWDVDTKELKKIDENSFESDRVVKAMRKAGYEWSEETHQLKKIVQKSAWCPSKKQMESLKDMLKYNIGVFDYQKFMEVNSLYEDLKKILDYETDRQR